MLYELRSSLVTFALTMLIQILDMARQAQLRQDQRVLRFYVRQCDDIDRSLVLAKLLFRNM